MRKSTITIIIGLAIILLGGGLFFSFRTEPQARRTAELAAASASSGPTTRTYTDPQYDFSFELPPDITISLTDDPVGHIIFGDRPDGTTTFMIVVSPFKSIKPLSANLIRESVPPADLRGDIEPFRLASGITGFTLFRPATVLGSVQDVIFVHRGDYYHISILTDELQRLAVILSTWRFTQ